MKPLHDRAIEFVEQLLKSYRNIPQDEDAIERLTYILNLLKETQ